MTHAAERSRARTPLQGIRRAWRRVAQFNRAVSLTYIVTFLSVIAVIWLHDTAPIIPFQYHTLIWILSLIFPVLAVSYSLARLRVRRNELIEAARTNHVWFVYFPNAKSEADAELDFTDMLQDRLDEYYSIWEFATYSLLAGIVAFSMFELLAVQIGIPEVLTPGGLKPWPVEIVEHQKWALLVGSGFLGSFAGGIVLIIRKHAVFDLRPTTFLQVAIIMVSGTLAAAFLAEVFPEQFVPLLAFTVGYLSAINIDFLSYILRRQFASITNISLPEPDAGDLSSMISNSEAIEALNRMSIYSVKELAAADPIKLFFNVPQSLRMIISMIDEAILRSNIDETTVQNLRKVHVVRFTLLLTRFKPIFHREGTDWRRSEKVEILGDEKQDKTLLDATAAILRTGAHHTLMGVILYHYRKTHFPWPGLDNFHKDLQATEKTDEPPT